MSGTNVREWQDQSGHGRHVQQTAPQQQPLLVPGALGGVPALRFDGKDDLLNNTIDLLPVRHPRTVLIAGRTHATGGAVFSFRRQTTGGKPIFVVQQGAYQGNFYVYTDGVNGAGNSTSPVATLEKIRQPFLSVHTSAGAGKKLTVRLNGAPQSVAQPGAVGFGWGGDLAEVLVYDRVLEAKELEQAERYLATRYNLPVPQRVAVAVQTGEKARAADERLIEELFLTALCRQPTVTERKTLLDYLSETKDRQAALEDIFWTVLNTKEFLFRP